MYKRHLWKNPDKGIYDQTLWTRPIKETQVDILKILTAALCPAARSIPTEETYERDLKKRPVRKNCERDLQTKKHKPYTRDVGVPAALCPAARSISFMPSSCECAKSSWSPRSATYVGKYIHIQMYIYVYIYVYFDIHIYGYYRIYVCMCIYVCVYIYIYIYICIHMYICRYIHIHIHIYIYI